MSNIVFCFPPIISTINSSLGLAKNLAVRGHKVCYFGVADCESVIINNGFEFVSFFEEWFPKGWFETIYLGAIRGENKEALDKLSEQLNIFVDYILRGGDREIVGAVSNIKPDLIIISTSGIDSILWAFIFYKLRINCLYFFDVLGGKISYQHPPVYFDYIYKRTCRSIIKTMMLWIVFLYKKQRLENTSNKTGFGSKRSIKRLAKYYGYPCRDISFNSDMPNPLLKIPELIAFPQEFEFLGIARKNRYYLEASIDLNRFQVTFPWEKINNSQPIVYVALGTLPLLSEADYKRFFNIVIKAAEMFPEWNWVLSIGNNNNVDEFHSKRVNIIVVNTAPQLTLLSKAKLMITHGGPNSIKECIYFGVPMILFPLWFDQPGNVARVVSHGMGLQANFYNITANELQRLVLEILSEASYKENIVTMQEVFRKREEEKPSLAIIESFLANA